MLVGALVLCAGSVEAQGQGDLMVLAANEGTVQLQLIVGAQGSVASSVQTRPTRQRRT